MGKLASNVLNSIDNAAKETLEEGAPKQPSATQIRSQRRAQQEGASEAAPAAAAPSSSSATEAPLPTPASAPASTGAHAAPAVARPAPAAAAVPPAAAAAAAASSDEIDRLNAECLELEDQVASLKKEVQEAWDSYKVAQERAALREAELMDELKAVQKAKQTDKQSLLSQMGKVGEEVDEAVKQMRAMQTERDTLQAQLRAAMDAAAKWAAKEAALEGQLAEARAGSIQGAQGLREEMRAIVASSELVRQEHASLMRQSQVRQAELEQANVELTINITERQREVTRLKLALERAGREDGETAVREVDGLRQQMAALTAQLEEERLRCQQHERARRHAECEAKAAAMNWDDEKHRLQATVSSLEATAASLEDRLAKEKQHSGARRAMYPSSPFAGGHGGSSGDEDAAPGGAGVLVMTEEDEIRADLHSQVKNLTQQLLKKQGVVLDLQAERAALKSRNQDLQARCSKVEQQLAALRDVDDDDDRGYGAGRDGDGDTDPESGHGSGGGGGGYDFFSPSSGTGLKQRRADGGTTRALEKVPQQHKVITNLEKMGVRPTEGVARAVNLIDAWTFMTGKFLRRYPLVRLGFVFYLLVLHLWVFFIIGMHTHSLELDTTPQQALGRPVIKAAAAAAAAGAARAPGRPLGP